MSSEPVRISRKELSSDDVIDRLDEGQRVIVVLEVFGVEREVTLRKSGSEYVCDTGFKLLTYDDQDGMKRCIERLRLAKAE